MAEFTRVEDFVRARAKASATSPSGGKCTRAKGKNNSIVEGEKI